MASDLAGNDGTYAYEPADVVVVTDLAQAIAAEACGELVGITSLNGLTADIAAPFTGLNKVSPYNETRCLFQVVTAFATNGNSGQCVLIPQNAARTIQLIAIEDKGDGTDGETKTWTAAAE